ncbi:MAG: DUF2156 domain-containing protein [Fusobacteriaceae bacterium]
MNWKDLTIDSKEIISSYTENKFEICDYNFSNLYLWSLGDKLKYAVEDEFLYIKGDYLGEDSYLMPISLKDNFEIQQMIEAIDKIIGEKKNLDLIPEKIKIKLENYYVFEEMENSFDYIYLMEDLAFLKGRKYSKKKNKLNQFNKNYTYIYEQINENNLLEVIEFQKKWCKERECDSIDTLRKENIGLSKIFENFTNLKIKGGMLKVDNEVIAYALGEELTKDMFVVHVEKANEEYKGSYQAINSIFLEKECFEYQYINREDDSGVPGIKQAKESYYPIRMEKKYKIIKKIF